MFDMKKLSYEFRIPGRSIEAVHNRFERSLLTHQQNRQIKFSGRKLSAEAFVNAIMLNFLDLPEEQQTAMLAREVSRFEAMLSDEQPIPAQPERTPIVEVPQSAKRKEKVG